MPQQALVEKTFHRRKAHGLSRKEKVPVPVISKEGHTDSFLGT